MKNHPPYNQFLIFDLKKRLSARLSPVFLEARVKKETHCKASLLTCPIFALSWAILIGSTSLLNEAVAAQPSTFSQNATNNPDATERSSNKSVDHEGNPQSGIELVQKIKKDISDDLQRDLLKKILPWYAGLLFVSLGAWGGMAWLLLWLNKESAVKDSHASKTQDEKFQKLWEGLESKILSANEAAQVGTEQLATELGRIGEELAHEFRASVLGEGGCLTFLKNAHDEQRRIFTAATEKSDQELSQLRSALNAFRETSASISELAKDKKALLSLPRDIGAELARFNEAIKPIRTWTEDTKDLREAMNSLMKRLRDDHEAFEKLIQKALQDSQALQQQRSALEIQMHDQQLGKSALEEERRRHAIAQKQFIGEVRRAELLRDEATVQFNAAKSLQKEASEKLSDANELQQNICKQREELTIALAAHEKAKSELATQAASNEADRKAIEAAVNELNEREALIGPRERKAEALSAQAQCESEKAAGMEAASQKRLQDAENQVQATHKMRRDVEQASQKVAEERKALEEHAREIKSKTIEFEEWQKRLVERDQDLNRASELIASREHAVAKREKETEQRLANAEEILRRIEGIKAEVVRVRDFYIPDFLSGGAPDLAPEWKEIENGCQAGLARANSLLANLSRLRWELKVVEGDSSPTADRVAPLLQAVADVGRSAYAFWRKDCRLQADEVNLRVVKLASELNPLLKALQLSIKVPAPGIPRDYIWMRSSIAGHRPPGIVEAVLNWAVLAGERLSEPRFQAVLDD